MRDSTFWALLLLCALVTIVIVLATGGLPVMAATVEPQATATPVIPCPLWRTAGAQQIFKCVDDEAPWATCYVPVGGVMQCLKE